MRWPPRLLCGVGVSAGTARASEVQKNVGYIELGSTSGARAGYALCIFESRAFDWLATVQEGQIVRLACQFANVEGDRPDRYPVFRKCWAQYQADSIGCGLKATYRRHETACRTAR
jgi:hypothetical protein